METVTIDGVDYIPKTDAMTPAFDPDGRPYQIIRTYSAGVFAGYVESRNGKEVVIRRARRLWYWAGAASLSQLAVSGTSKPDDCKFPVEMDRTTVTEVIEIIDCTEAARDSIEGVKVWAQ